MFGPITVAQDIMTALLERLPPKLLVSLLIILFPFILFSLFPLIFTSPMINYSTINVKEMSEAQMEALKGLKYVEGSGNASDHNIITRDQLPTNCRVIPPGSMVTMDWQEDRLNVHLDADNKIKKVKKG